MDYITLRGLVISRFGTLTNFAKALGWSERKVSYIISGKQEASASDIEAMAAQLSIDIPEEMRRIFFATPSTNCGQEVS